MCDTIYLQAPTPIFQAPVVSFLDLRRSTSSAPETWSTSCGRLQILPPACILQAPAQCVCVCIYIYRERESERENKTNFEARNAKTQQREGFGSWDQDFGFRTGNISRLISCAPIVASLMRIPRYPKPHILSRASSRDSIFWKWVDIFIRACEEVQPFL